MKFNETEFAGLYLIEPLVFGDDRGYFLESFNSKSFEEKIHPIKFVQDNESRSCKGVLRGLHFQKPPFEQSKLVRCIEGRIFDVAVDLRNGSLTYGKHLAVELSGENKRQVFVPRGFAHGFVVLSKTAVVSYKVDNWYAPDFDSGIRFDDKELSIDWGVDLDEVQLSEKDKMLPSFNGFLSPFKF
ncbi:dTDP-4-dehydrorhamnose 3,5-epimerase [Akkermansiaceae bacterium]|nr:dTDP-4-dehydrorhamnose 3,5-epimerase [Akkermansiaceae bacterium]